MESNHYAPVWVSAEQGPDVLCSQVLPGLFQGGTPDEDWRFVRDTGVPADWYPPFDAAVTLFAWAEPVDWGVEELRYGFQDGDVDRVDMDRVIDAARWAYRRWQDGATVLIRCQAGLNRSGLVTALMLMLHGFTAPAAIALIRQQRAEVALCNNQFVDWLLSEADEALFPQLGPGSPSASPSMVGQS